MLHVFAGTITCPLFLSPLPLPSLRLLSFAWTISEPPNRSPPMSRPSPSPGQLPCRFQRACLPTTRNQPLAPSACRTKPKPCIPVPAPLSSSQCAHCPASKSLPGCWAPGAVVTHVCRSVICGFESTSWLLAIGGRCCVMSKTHIHLSVTE